FRFKSRVWVVKPQDAHRSCSKCCGKTVEWMYGNEIFRVTARTDKYGEERDWIRNECRCEKKNVNDWEIEGPTKIDRHSVISANKYTIGTKVNAPKNIGYGNTN